MKGNTMTGRDLKRAKANSNRAIEERASKQLHRIWELEAALSPFADIADEIERTASEAACKTGTVVGAAKWKDCKRARDALRERKL